MSGTPRGDSLESDHYPAQRTECPSEPIASAAPNLLSFGRVVGAVVVGLVVGSFAASALLLTSIVWLDSGQQGTWWINIPWAVMLMPAYSVPIGALPALVYGAPAYYLLQLWSSRRSARMFGAGVLGVLPGLVLLGLNPDEPMVGLVFGNFSLCVALATHAFAERMMSRRAGRRP